MNEQKQDEAKFTLADRILRTAAMTIAFIAAFWLLAELLLPKVQ